MKTQYIVLLTLTLAACSQKKEGGLDGKKAELAELQKQQGELNTKIQTLEAEILKLDPKKAEEAKVKSVAVTPLAASTFKHLIEVQGTVDAKNNVSVSPQSSGVIKAVYVKEGDAVGVGTVLAKLDDDILRESIEETKNQLSLANTLYDKQKRLWDQQIGTEIQYLQAKNNKESLEKRIATLQVQLGQSKVLAPIAGTVDQVDGKVGMMASPGVGILRVINLSSLKVVAKVADSYVANVRRGDAVTIRFPDLQKEIQAKVSFVSTAVDPLSRTFTIEALLPASKDLKPNMLAQVLINDVTKNNALIIDQNLIQNTENGQIVYVAVSEGNKKVAKARTVKTGLSYAGKIEITEGLKAGDELITIGYQELTDGQPISY
ncbi:efflux RND transporter periplasmic adaptor subunit [Siphonobacter aquaeclarae]|jgi:membrane fusion protein (multidrug efflux system)|uniref:RND family efflux transporter, MFP subunit n=1 Tax=Siphonobacter aquaeclarae TaxID=563176 RepID=A0A1G9V1D1_9BACT|nr:efflux RND transporter periplasmic adaptor subunit [Siphonobacter aquaeclarae]MBO9638556.1 efflux RND transporter periplasmic adaptor subunit [Siphonobacter aquaeclarae]SDM66034.1 RND family efflux transporter, MFP subunit [Siphonobacter aquaeclarae]